MDPASTVESLLRRSGSFRKGFRGVRNNEIPEISENVHFPPMANPTTKCLGIILHICTFRYWKIAFKCFIFMVLWLSEKCNLKGSSFQTAAGERGAIAREECLQLSSLLKGERCGQNMAKYWDGSGSVVVNRFIPRVLEYMYICTCLHTI